MQNGACPVIVIFAPTACGKTALVEKLFGQSSLYAFKGMAEAVSADSQAVYRSLNIGTAKPTENERKQIPYHLIDIVDADEQFGLGDFLPSADSACKEILSRNKVPIVVGGTGFYIRAFLMGLPKTPESDPSVRAGLKERIEKEGNSSLYEELKKVDPATANRIHINDAYRICRALEVYYTLGKPLSLCRVPETLRKDFNFCTIVLERPREELYSRIEKRVEEMFSQGLCNEVEELKKMGFTKESPGMKAIGYHEFFEEDSFLSDGSLDLESVKKKIVLNSRHYAKKQYTYIKDIPDSHIINADDTEEAYRIIKDFLAESLW